MDKRYKIFLTILRTTVLLGIGTAGLIRELFFKDHYDLQLVIICWAFITGEGAISAWVLGRIHSTIEQPSQAQSSSEF